MAHACGCTPRDSLSRSASAARTQRSPTGPADEARVRPNRPGANEIRQFLKQFRHAIYMHAPPLVVLFPK